MSDSCKILIIGACCIILLVVICSFVLAQKKEKSPYEFANILTKYELRFYELIKPYADSFNYQICPKVRLADFAKPKKDRDKKWFYLVSSKHIDFLICDSKMNPLFGIELDDSSHNTKEAQKKDVFKDNVFREIGLPLRRVTEINRETINSLFTGEVKIYEKE